MNTHLQGTHTPNTPNTATRRADTHELPPNLDWWDGHDHDYLYEHRKTTLLHIPRTLQDKYIALKATLLHELSKPQYEDGSNPDTHRLWKLLLHFDRLLLARPPEHNNTKVKTQTITQLVNTRIDLYLKRQWHQLHSPNDPHTAPPNKTQTHAELGKAITKLMHAGEVSRATSLLNSPGKFTTDPNRLPEIEQLHKHRYGDPTPQRQDVPSATPAQLEAHLHKALKTLAPRKQHGPEASRNEHWQLLHKHPQHLRPPSILVHRIANGKLPEKALDAI